MYDISVLSNIPLSVCDVIDPAAPSQRLRPLFCIGVHDLSSLLEYQAPAKRGRRSDDNDDNEPHDDGDDDDDSAAGWVACTTDSILAMKEGLWDMLITMPPPYSSNATQRVWPTVECPKGVPVRATQRDLRRFRSLALGLARLAPLTANSTSTRPPPPAAPPAKVHSPPSEASDSPVPPAPGIRLSAAVASSSRPGTATAATGDRPSGFPTTSSDDDTDTIVEPTTWAALAYNGFMWWASAGEKRHSDEVDEQSHDASLLTDLAPPPFSPTMTTSSSPHLRANRQREPNLTAAAATAPAPGDMLSSLASLAAVGSPGATGDDDDEDDNNGPDTHHGRRNDEAQARIELAVVAYFHRLTTSVMTVIADIVDSSDDDDLLGLGLLGGGSGGGGGYFDYTDGPSREESSSGGGLRGRRRGLHESSTEDDNENARLLGNRSGTGISTSSGTTNTRGSQPQSRHGNEDTSKDNNGDNETSRFPWVRIDSEVLAEMGLDVWSQADADFVVDVAARYFARRAYVETKGVEVCGVRVC